MMGLFDLDTEQSLEMDYTGVQYTTRNRVSVHPIDNEKAATDHAQPQPEEVRITVVVTESRFGPRATEPEGTAGYINMAERFFRASLRHRFAIFLPGAPTLVPYQLVDWSRQRGSLDRLEGTLTFQELVIARATTVRIPPRRTNRSGGPDEQKLGQQTPQDQGESTLVTAGKWLGLLDE